MEEIFEILQKMVSTSQKISFHQPECRIRFQTTFPLDEQKLSLAEMSEKQVKKRFHQRENLFPLTGMRLKIFLQSRRKNTASSSWSVSKRKKKMASTGRKISVHLQESGHFSKIGFPDSHKQKKTLNKRILFQVDKKSVFTNGNEEFV